MGPRQARARFRRGGGKVTLGESITLDELERDPYSAYARLREEEPVSWVPDPTWVLWDPA